MILYKAIPRFNRSTGAKEEDSFEVSGDLICDYTGILMEEQAEHRSEYDLTVGQTGGSESTWYYDKERSYFEDLGIEFDSLFEDGFDFLVREDCGDVSMDMMLEWKANMGNIVHPFGNVHSLEELLRAARIRTIKKLLEAKTYAPAQLGLDPVL